MRLRHESPPLPRATSPDPAASGQGSQRVRRMTPRPEREGQSTAIAPIGDRSGGLPEQRSVISRLLSSSLSRHSAVMTKIEYTNDTRPG